MKRALITGITGQDVSYLAEKIARLTGFTGEIRWDSSRTDGRPRRCLDFSRAKEYFGFEAKMPFDEGLEATIDWYVANRGGSEVIVPWRGRPALVTCRGLY